MGLFDAAAAFMTGPIHRTSRAEYMYLLTVCVCHPSVRAIRIFSSGSERPPGAFPPLTIKRSTHQFSFHRFSPHMRALPDEGGELKAICPFDVLP